MNAGNAASWAAAGAAILAAGVVAWQSWETRRSANASRDAAVAANAALDLSRQQVAEAIRARIDASMPEIVVQAPREVQWPPLSPPRHLGDHPQPFPRVDEFAVMHLPKHGDEQIMVRAEFTIFNESTRHVELATSTLVDADDNELPNPLRLAPGERVTGLFSVKRTLTDWVRIYKQREAGEPGDETKFSVTYMDPSDTGAMEHWHVAVAGCPVEEVTDVQGWRIVGAPSAFVDTPRAMGIGEPIRYRRYWLSRTRDQPLPD